ncbi:MFS transporter [Paractinoplanes abujensis]|uniref:MFS family permease n=1 Tax=Paractinoplanes abujensis TaxID=882441 RepID=A0A7W7G2U9_9ACTN|nr:MFS transporter [Actinoplanes abujensis]MBB4693505.1 MFS family permease [Actinoplanes abujensis]GID21835.1 MFS transporter [Actinoplanes abujensis]
MTPSDVVAADPTIGGHRGLDSGRAKAIVAALAITQTVGYGTLYYAFAVFLVPLAADLNTSTTAVTGTFTASVLASAALAVPVGRWLDRRGARALMTAGSLAGTLLLVAWSQLHTLGQLYAVQIGIGVASAACLYEAAFAVVIAWHTARRRPSALLALTVVAGFASTIFLPLTGWLVEQHGWRTALLVLAAVQAVLTTPLHLIVLRAAPRNQRTAHGPQLPAVRLRDVFSDRVFWLLTAGFTTNMAAISIVTVHLVAALTSWGHTATFAAGVAGLFGILSVAGRLATTGLQRRYRISTVVAVIFAVQALAIGLLPFIGRNATAVIAAIIGFGLGFGVSAIAKPVLLADCYDTRRYATIAGTMVVPMTIAKAGAPLAAAALHARSGTYTSLLLATAALCAIAAVTLWTTSAYPRHRPETAHLQETSS